MILKKGAFVMLLQTGQRGALDKYFDLSRAIDVKIEVQGGSVYDSCCFGVDADEQLSDDRYMVFFNQPASPKCEIQYEMHGKAAEYHVNLQELPAAIKKLVFTISIDGSGTMGDIQSHQLRISQYNAEPLEFNLSGQAFAEEKAIISIELYQKNGWRFATVGRGFNGGLGDLLRSFGGVEIEEKPAPQKQAPKKISLLKGQKVSLEKNTGAPVVVENGWLAEGKDYDLKALVRYRNGRLIYVGAANRDEVLKTPEGAVEHGGDVKEPGELEHILIKWHPDIASIAVSSYSALENGTGSFNAYGVFVRIKNGSQIIEIPAADTNMNELSYTLCFGEIVFGTRPQEMEVRALERYSKEGSERRIGYIGEKVVMDIGPEGCTK